VTAEARAGDAPNGRVRRIVANLSAWASALVQPPRCVPARLLPATGQLLLGIVIAGAVVAAVMAWLDAGAILRVKTLPPWLVDTFNEITDFGRSGWFLLPAGVLIVVAAALASPALGRITNLVLVSLVVRVGFVFLAIGVPGLFVSVVKRLIGRVRPSDLGPFAYVPWSWRPDYAGLPSGHATTAFAAAVAIGAVWPRARLAMWIYAGGIALSRVIVEAHYPSDVLAGAVAGVFGAVLVRNWFAARRRGFLARPDGSVRALPGPSLHRVKMVARRLFAQ
jgi:membrane-associated phospholipid phosphatase